MRMLPKDLQIAIENDASLNDFPRVFANAIQQVPIRLARYGKKDPDDMDVGALNNLVDLEDPEAEENSDHVFVNDEATLSALKGSKGKGKGIQRFCFATRNPNVAR